MVLSPAAPAISLAIRAMTGETACGDRCGWWAAPGRIVMAVADGLGHGAEAAVAAEAALACVGDRHALPVDDLFALCDARLRDTRGVALAVAIIDLATQHLLMASVGNIRAVLLDGVRERHLGGARGIVGAGYGRLAPESMPLAQGDVIALYSDGLDEFFGLRDVLAGLQGAMAGAAGEVLQRCARGHDDASLLIYRHAGP